MIEIKRIISAALVAGTALVSVVVPSASASERGGIAWSATKGNAETLITVYTETGCQYPATKVKAELFGEGLQHQTPVAVPHRAQHDRPCGVHGGHRSRLNAPPPPWCCR